MDQSNQFLWVWQSKNPESDVKEPTWVFMRPMIFNGNVLYIGEQESTITTVAFMKAESNVCVYKKQQSVKYKPERKCPRDELTA